MKERILNDDEFCIQIAKYVYEDLGKTPLIKSIRQGKARFTTFSHFIVMRGFRNHFEKFDLRYNVYAHYKKKELYDESRNTWKPSSDSFNSYQYHDLKVVAREEIKDKSPEEIATAMQDVFRANVLVLKTYAGPAEDLKNTLKKKSVTLLFDEEIKQ